MAEIALVRGDTLKLALADIKLSDGTDYVPISIQLDNKTFYAVPFLYNNQV